MSLGERRDGSLSDPQAQRRARRASEHAATVILQDLQTLQAMPAFKRFMGRLIQRCGLTDDLQTTNGGDLQRFMGRRSIAVEVLAEIEMAEAGFYERVLSARRAFEQELQTARQTAEPSKENDDD